MLFYLRVINPALSLLVFMICTWSAIAYDSNNGLNLGMLIAGSFPSYFFAKGLYTGGSLFLLGKILLEILSRNIEKPLKANKRSDALFFIVFLTFSMGSLTGLYLWSKNTTSATSTETSFSNPSELTVKNSYRVSESTKLRIGGIIKNSSNSEWTSIKIKTKIYIDKKYSSKSEISIVNLNANQENEFLIDFDDLRAADITDSITWVFEIEGSRK